MRKNTPFFIFILFALLVILYHVFGYYGHFGYDDMLYAQIAKDWVDGIVHYDNAFSYRFTIIAFTALSYLLLGVRDLASAIPSMVVAIGILYVVYRILKQEGALQTFLGLSLTTTVNAFLFYTDKMMPDIYVALFLLLAIFWYHRSRFASDLNSNKVFFLALLFSLSIFFAFCSKETAVLFLPLPMVLLMADLFNRRNVRFWVVAFTSGVLIVAVYLGIVKILTGDFFTRVDALTANHQSQSFLYSYDRLPISMLYRRLSSELVLGYLKEGMLVPFVLMVPALISKGFRNIFRISNPFDLYLVSSLVLLVSANFMTISPFSYHPVPAEARHSLFLIPVAAIAASFVLKEFFVEKRYLHQTWILMAMVSVVAMWIDQKTALYLYIPLTLLFVVFGFVNVRKIHPIGFVLLLTLVLFVKPLLFFYHSAVEVKYPMQREMVYDYLIKSKESCFVFTDPVQKNFGDYYTGFDPNSRCRFIDFTKINSILWDTIGKKYLLLNWHTQYCSKSYDKLPYMAYNIDSAYTLLYENKKKYGMALYEMPQVSVPELNGLKLFETKNDFEIAHPHWSDAGSERVSLKGKVGNKVSRLGDYSDGFSVLVDSLNEVGASNLYVACRFQGWFSSTPSADLVVTVEDDQGVVFWKGKELSSEVPVIKQWVTLNYGITLDRKDILPGRRIKIYLWNKRSDIAYIDDFEIVIYKPI